MKRKRRWSIVGFTRFCSVTILLHILLTLGRVRVMDARDAKYLVVSTILRDLVEAYKVLLILCRRHRQ